MSVIVAAAPATSGRRSVARASLVKAPSAATKNALVARKSLQGASIVNHRSARRAGLARQQAVVKAAVGTGKGDLEMVTLKDGDDYAEIYTFGGVCTSYVKDGKDVLYVRPDAKFDKSKPISGGIPHCWPQFGPGAMQVHGFARNVQWELTSSDDTSCVMTLTPSDYTKEMWPYEFKVTQTITLKDGSLTAAMAITNTDDKDFEFTGSFHTYFACDNISDVKINGLGGLTVFDRLTETESTASGAIMIDGPVDSVYSGDIKSPLSVDVGAGRIVSIGFEGWPDAVVWSPWTDMDCYQEFVCVENGACSPVKVAPGATWNGSMTLSTNAPDPIDKMCEDDPAADECRVFD